TIQGKLTGQLLLPASLKTGGTVNSVANTIVWDPITVPALAVLGPQAEGDVSVEIDLAPAFPIRRIGDKNFTVKAVASIQSPTIPAGVAATQTVSLADLETKVLGATDFESAVYYYDPGGIADKGPYPPQVNKPTQFTVHWRLKNYSTDITN